MLNKKLRRSDFVIWYGEIYHCTLLTTNKTYYELALEPCDFGFDVALYERTDITGLKLVTKRVCTEVIDLYENDPFHTKERNLETWGKAIKIAQQCIDTYLV